MFSLFSAAKLQKISHISEGKAKKVLHKEAIEKAEREFEIYREREMRLLESDFNKAVKLSWRITKAARNKCIDAQIRK